MDRYEGFPARGTGRSTPNAHAVAPSGPKCPSRSRIYDGGSLRRFLHTQTGEAHVDACLTWTLSPGGAVPAAASCVDVFFQHCKKDLIWRRRRHLQSRCRSSIVEFGSPSTIAAFGVTPAVNRTRRSGSRAAFLSRGPTFGGRRTDLVCSQCKNRPHMLTVQELARIFAAHRLRVVDAILIKVRCAGE